MGSWQQCRRSCSRLAQAETTLQQPRIFYVDIPGAGRPQTCYERLAEDRQRGLNFLDARSSATVAREACILGTARAVTKNAFTPLFLV